MLLFKGKMFALSFLSFFISYQASGSYGFDFNVSCKNGALSLEKRLLDFKLDNSKLGMSIYYNSMSLSNGIFGRKWSSVLDKRLKLLSEKAQVIVAGEIRNTIELKKSKNIRALRLVKKDENYKLIYPSGGYDIYTEKGRLLSIYNLGCLYQIDYKNDKIFAVKGCRGEQIFFTYHAGTNLVKEIKTSSRKSLKFSYEKGFLRVADKTLINSTSADLVERILGLSVEYYPKSYRVKKVWSQEYNAEYQYKRKRISNGNKIFSCSAKTKGNLFKTDYEYNESSAGKRTVATRKYVNGILVYETNFSGAKILKYQRAKKLKVEGTKLSLYKDGQKIEKHYSNNGKISTYKSNGNFVSFHYKKNGTLDYIIFNGKKRIKIFKKYIAMREGKKIFKFPIKGRIVKQNVMSEEIKKIIKYLAIANELFVYEGDNNA